MPRRWTSKELLGVGSIGLTQMLGPWENQADQSPLFHHDGGLAHRSGFERPRKAAK